jgi:cyclophilin family peptidyl-prolyl cis-trans isomerase
MTTKVRFEIVLNPSAPETVSLLEVEVNPDWAPIGAKRFLDLIACNYYDDARIYRVIPNFIAQWGVPANPAEWKKWGENKIKDDPVKVSNTKGTMSFATSGPNARGSQVFINYTDDCAQLDDQGCAPRRRRRCRRRLMRQRALHARATGMPWIQPTAGHGSGGQVCSIRQGHRRL